MTKHPHKYVSYVYKYVCKLHLPFSLHVYNYRAPIIFLNLGKGPPLEHSWPAIILVVEHSFIVAW